MNKPVIIDPKTEEVLSKIEYSWTTITFIFAGFFLLLLFVNKFGHVGLTQESPDSFITLIPKRIDKRVKLSL